MTDLPPGTPQEGGVLTIYSIPSTYLVFDVTAAIDESLTDGARGLLWRILAKSKLHGLGWKIWIKELIDGNPEGRDIVRSRLAELREHGYVRRYRLRREDGSLYWVTEASEQPIFENDAIKPEVTQMPAEPAELPQKRSRKARSESPANPKVKPARKSNAHAHPAYHELVRWWVRPKSEGGRGMAVTSKQWGRIGIGINEVIELALKMKWLEADSDASTLIHYLDECTKWIEDHKPYKGVADFGNYPRRLLEWWDEIGRQKHEASEGSSVKVDYTPMIIA